MNPRSNRDPSSTDVEGKIGMYMAMTQPEMEAVFGLFKRVMGMETALDRRQAQALGRYIPEADPARAQRLRWASWTEIMQVLEKEVTKRITRS